MKRWIGAVLAACLLALSAVPAAAQGSGLRLQAQPAGARREDGVYLPHDPARARAQDYGLLFADRQYRRGQSRQVYRAGNGLSLRRAGGV